jgi:hypothetical protein
MFARLPTKEGAQAVRNLWKKGIRRAQMEITVSLGILRHPETGELIHVATANKNQWNSAMRAASRRLGFAPIEVEALGAKGLANRTHAERLFFDYAERHGLEPVGLIPSTRFCPGCEIDVLGRGLR